MTVTTCTSIVDLFDDPRPRVEPAASVFLEDVSAVIVDPVAGTPGTFNVAVYLVGGSVVHLVIVQRCHDAAAVAAVADRLMDAAYQARCRPIKEKNHHA